MQRSVFTVHVVTAYTGLIKEYAQISKATTAQHHNPFPHPLIPLALHMLHYLPQQSVGEQFVGKQ